MMNTLVAPERLARRSRLLRASARRAATSLAGLIVLALLPKCPFCVAAYLTALGLSASIAALLAPLLRPAAALVLVAALLACLFAVWRQRRAATTCEAATTAASGRPGTCCGSDNATRQSALC
jgi:hypothetical protein